MSNSFVFNPITGNLDLVGSGSSGGTGNVTGAASSTANQLPTFSDTTGKSLQASTATVDSKGQITLNQTGTDNSHAYNNPIFRIKNSVNSTFNPSIVWDTTSSSQGLSFYSYTGTGYNEILRLQDNGAVYFARGGTLGGMNFGDYYIQRGNGPILSLGTAGVDCFSFSSNGDATTAFSSMVGVTMTNPSVVGAKFYGATSQTSDFIQTIPHGTSTPNFKVDVNGNVTGTSFNGSGSGLTGIPATQLSGNIPVANLNSGTGASSTTFWRGDGTWATPAGGGSGTVTSVALAAPAEFSVSGSPVTGSGTITFAKANQTANTVWAGPTTGSAAAPSFRALVSADIPAINIGSTGAGGVAGSLPVSSISATGTASSTTYLRGDGSWSTPSGGSSVVVPMDFGDGSDGDVTITNNFGVFPNRDMYYHNLTISGGGVLVPGGYRVFVSGTLTINSGCLIDYTNITNAGKTAATYKANSATSSTGATGSSGWIVSTNSTMGGYTGGGNGGAGGTTTGTAGSAGTNSGFMSAGGVSGSSGAGGTGTTGNTGGAAKANNAYVGGAQYNSLKQLTTTYLAMNSSTNGWGLAGGGLGGPGGSGGGGDGTNAGGGGGAGGRAAQFGWIRANTIVNNGNIYGMGEGGGNGFTPTTGNCGGGGGGSGGGGGVVILQYYSYSGSGAISVSGGAAGTGGSGVGTGTAGGNGSAGSAGQIIKFNGTTGLFE